MAKSSGLKNAPSTTGNPSGKGRANNPQANQAEVQKPPLPQKAGLKKASKSHSTTIKSKHQYYNLPIK